jgi:hypothetical protein
MVGSMRETLGLVESQLRTFARDEGGIPDGHGYVWGPVQGKGKEKGEVFQWRREP